MELALFSVTPVTLEPITALMIVEPEPVPEFVTVPVLFTLVVERVIPASVELLLFSMRLPVPVVPPDTVRSFVPLLLVRVVPPLFTVMAVVLIVRAEVVLFSVIPVTLLPIPPLIVVVPPPVPALVIEPTLLALTVEIVIAAAVLASRVRFPVPVIPPLIVSAPVIPPATIRSAPPRARPPLKVAAPVPWRVRSPPRAKAEVVKLVVVVFIVRVRFPVVLPPPVKTFVPPEPPESNVKSPVMLTRFESVRGVPLVLFL